MQMKVDVKKMGDNDEAGRNAMNWGCDKT